MKIRFYNRDGRWFADVPSWIEQGGTEDDCEMVCGADLWLDYLSKYTDSITLELSKEPLNESIHIYHKDKMGATYIAHEFQGEAMNIQMWLCNVTIHVLGEFPPIIHYKIIK